MENLAKDIKNNSIRNLYLFFGEERYLVSHYENIVTKKVLDSLNGMEDMNSSVLVGKEVTSENVVDASETLPFFAQRRLVLVKDSGLFAQGRKAESELMSKYIDDIPDTTVLIFVEFDVDKRSALYKKVGKKGSAIEFKTPDEKDLIAFIARRLKDSAKIISNSTSIFLLRTIDASMSNIAGEIDKLISFIGDENEIKTSHINAICNKSFEAKIFDMVKAIGNKNAETALIEFSNLLQNKESPIMVLTMISRQFRLILQCKYLLNQKYSESQIATKIGVRSFFLKEYINQSKNFDLLTLKKALEDCLESDVNIKTGKISDTLAVETLILKYCCK